MFFFVSPVVTSVNRVAMASSSLAKNNGRDVQHHTKIYARLAGTFILGCSLGAVHAVKFISLFYQKNPKKPKTKNKLFDGGREVTAAWSKKCVCEYQSAEQKGDSPWCAQ